MVCFLVMIVGVALSTHTQSGMCINFWPLSRFAHNRKEYKLLILYSNYNLLVGGLSISISVRISSSASSKSWLSLSVQSCSRRAVMLKMQCLLLIEYAKPTPSETTVCLGAKQMASGE
jgi:hypothetical protein